MCVFVFNYSLFTSLIVHVVGWPDSRVHSLQEDKDKEEDMEDT